MGKYKLLLYIWAERVLKCDELVAFIVAFLEDLHLHRKFYWAILENSFLEPFIQFCRFLLSLSQLIIYLSQNRLCVAAVTTARY